MFVDGNKISSVGNGIAMYEHCRTYVLNMVNVGPQMVKNRTVDWTNPKSRFLNTYLGAQNFEMVKHEQCLLIATVIIHVMRELF